MKFIPLNIKTTYSFLKSALTISDLAKASSTFNYSGVGIADENALFGICEFVKTMDKNKYSSVIGATLSVDQYTIVCYIKNEEGYANLIHLVSVASKTPLTFEQFKTRASGLIQVFPAVQKAINIFEDDAVATLKKTLIPFVMLTNDFYLGIDMNNPKNHAYVQNVRAFAQKYNYDCIAFPTIEYMFPNDAITLKILEAIEKNEKLSTKEYIGYNYFKTNEAYNEEYSEIEIFNQTRLLESSNFHFFKKRGNILNYGKLTNQDSKELLRKLTFDGLRRIGKDADLTYVDRVNYELSVINGMGFEDYFLIVEDMIHYARTHGIPVGPGRGSAPGSLVSYCLGITEIDSIKYNLLFERFLNPQRLTMPDIDIDFEDIKRDQILTYLKDKYGEELVAHVITYQTIGAKQALRDIGRVFSYKESDISRMSKMVTEYNATLRQTYKMSKVFKDLIDSDSYYLEIVKLATKIEGLIRQRGQHAAGIILNDVPLEEAMPVVYDSDFVVSQFDKDYLEDLNFLKFDLLGLRNLQTIEYAISLINDNNLNLYNIPYEDDNVYKTIREDRVMGLFQLESTGMRSAVREVKPTSFDDIVAILALFRPGPMKNIPTFARRKNGIEPVPTMIKPLEVILKSTYGIIIYQEQIMQLVRNMAGFSYAEADTFRKAISKKHHETMEKLKKTFIDGSISNGYSSSDADTVFATIERFASYGFNKSHSVAYSVLACRMAYLKHYYPAQFFSALFETLSLINENKVQDYIKEMNYYGIKLNNPSVNLSEVRYYNVKNNIYIPLSAIKGIRNELVNKLVEIREMVGGFKDIHDFFYQLGGLRLDENFYRSLIDAGALDDFGYNRATLRGNLIRLYNCGALYAELLNKQNEMSDDMKVKIIEFEDDTNNDYKLEENALGIALSNNVLEINRDIIIALNGDNLALMLTKRNRNHAKLIGKVDRCRRIKNKNGEQMTFVDFTTLDSTISVTLFPSLNKTSGHLIRENSILIIDGYLNYYAERTTFVAEKITKLEEAF